MVVAASKVVPAFLGGFICIYGLVSGFVKERLFLSESLVAMLFGIVIGPQAINAVDPREFLDTDKFTLEFARYVIGIQVMAAGIMLPSRYIIRKWRTMSVLLGPVMLVMWLVTAGIIHLMFNIGFEQALLIASCAAPTDPILANSVVKGKYAEANVPKNVRDALSAESGINDGLGLPFLYFALYLLHEGYSTGHAMGRWFYWIWCYNILLSIVIGIVVGYVARKLLRLAETYELIDKESFLAFSIGLSIFIVGILQLIRSDDVLCCFIAGHAFTWDDWFREETKDAHFQEVLDGLINVTFFIYFGTIIPWHKFNNAELVIAPWRLIVAAIMVLLLRRLPIVVMLTRITPAFRNYRQSLFAGWFGPIGVGALFFAEIVLEEIEHDPEHFHYRSREIIVPIVSFLVFSSVLVHGITLPLLYIGKVVRSRSRSISSMSIRNGIASRLSFVNSREPAGIHGVHIPMIDSSRGTPVDYADAPAKRDGRAVFDVDTPRSYQSPAAHGSEDHLDGSLERDNDEDHNQAAPLDLMRTITIDDKPKVSRDQMDIHYPRDNIRQQYTQHVQNLHALNPLSGSKYSHLQMHNKPVILPPKSHSSYDIGALANSRGDIRGLETTDTDDAAEASVRVADARQSEIADRDSDVNARGHAEGTSVQFATEANPAAVAATATAAAATSAAAAAAAKEEYSQQSDEDGSLVLDADRFLASPKTSRTATRDTIMSAPELSKVHTRSSDLIRAPLSIHPSLPEAAGIEGSPSDLAAAHHVRRLSGSHLHRQRSNSYSGAGPIRHILRRRKRQQNVTANGSEQMCEFIGNHKNPLGRLEDGELVDYDDPNDDSAEQGFMDNNVDDRFIDYFKVDIGSNIRRWSSKLPLFGASRQTGDDEEHNAGGSGRPPV